MLIEGKEMRQRNAMVFKSEEGDARDFNCFQTPNNEWDVKLWHAINGFWRPIGRKGFHRKSSSPDMMRERVETESKELKSNQSHVGGEATPWVLDGRTGIYYPKGHEKVLDGIPDGGGATVNTQVNWFNDENI
ncbi:uncharacterized protein E5676_scaffold21G002970 [Cucumis melo var. makuwa]|uniref:Uncharacterized protein n=1 Tax=Cucumis melo var. makuwa TaxID=1194695 RepID=A0A5D3CX31_CUCMM|nr:uncharacterized protein E5676_scaffold21G002970 [Cucumis melo var. makuwa]